MVEAKGLKKSYGKTQVLQGVNFNIKKGEIFALLGSNGAGKTTTIQILSTLLRQDSGVAIVNGFDTATKPNEVRNAISLTGQFAAVDDVLTGRENLILIARLREVKDSEKIADGLLKQFGLVEAGKRNAGTYSGGMKRRLDIAMSLVGNPNVIFLDEPTTGLDPEAKQEVWKTVRQLAGSGTTILLTTQYLEEAEQLADRIAILHGGKIIADGTLTELKKLLLVAKKEHVERQPSLEDVFFALTGDKEEK